ncbi:unnamed protein product [Amoebophrya sp. A25]|nr:unnamed protein product [Amoebophrya sp. A25]|eukprot:GSA25T00020890001.1
MPSSSMTSSNAGVPRRPTHDGASAEMLQRTLEKLRAAYFRELTDLRGQLRKANSAINKDAIEAVEEVLVEQPVMYFEPLQFLSDEEEATKDFIQNTVAEKMRLLLLSRGYSSGDGVHDGIAKTKERNAELETLLRQQREKGEAEQTALRLEIQRLTDRLADAKEEHEEVKRSLLSQHAHEKRAMVTDFEHEKAEMRTSFRSQLDAFAQQLMQQQEKLQNIGLVGEEFIVSARGDRRPGSAPTPEAEEDRNGLPSAEELQQDLQRPPVGAAADEATPAQEELAPQSSGGLVLVPTARAAVSSRGNHAPSAGGSGSKNLPAVSRKERTRILLGKDHAVVGSKKTPSTSTTSSSLGSGRSRKSSPKTTTASSVQPSSSSSTKKTPNSSTLPPVVVPPTAVRAATTSDGTSKVKTSIKKQPPVPVAPAKKIVIASPATTTSTASPLSSIATSPLSV